MSTQVRAYFRKAERFCEVYELIQSDGALAEFVTTQLSPSRVKLSHRGVTQSDLKELLEDLLAGVEANTASDQQRHFCERLQQLLNKETADACDV